MSDQTHFTDWEPGGQMHTHIRQCIKCGGDQGEVAIFARLSNVGGRLALSLTGMGSDLCPPCKAKYLPLTHAMDKELTRLGDKLWRDLRKRGCPCCEAGLNWSPGTAEVA